MTAPPPPTARTDANHPFECCEHCELDHNGHALPCPDGCNTGMKTETVATVTP